jgi:hypothetical protein
MLVLAVPSPSWDRATSAPLIARKAVGYSGEMPLAMQLVGRPTRKPSRADCLICMIADHRCRKRQLTGVAVGYYWMQLTQGLDPIVDA